MQLHFHEFKEDKLEIIVSGEKQIKVTGQLDSGPVEILLVGVFSDLIFITSWGKKKKRKEKNKD